MFDTSVPHFTGFCIACRGVFRAGKDTVCGILEESHGFARDSFGSGIDRGTLAMDPWVQVKSHEVQHITAEDGSRVPTVYGMLRLSALVEAVGWERAKEVEDVRTIRQRYAHDACREIHGDNCWADALQRRWELGLKGSGIWLRPECPPHGLAVSDLRYENELDKLAEIFEGKEARGLVVWEIQNRNAPEPPGQSLLHASEQFRPPPDVVVHNHGTIDELRSAVRWALLQSYQLLARRQLTHWRQWLNRYRMEQLRARMEVERG